MTHSNPKRGPKTRGQITLSASRDIPFDKLVLSQSNVRRIKAGVSIEELAADIARRTLLQSLTVRPVLDEDGTETGMFEIPAGGRRYRALELLVQRKQLARTAPVPCVIRTEGLAEEDSLAENVQRAPLHPLDQFRAFMAMREKGMGEEEIAAAFFVSSNVVRQRLRMAAVSPALLEVYAEDGMSLEQLMAFTLNPDHARQDQVWEAIQQSWSKEPFHIRRLLTEHTVRADDKRALFIGAEAYEAAGGIILRDLFQTDHGGFLQDTSLLDRMVAQKLDSEADALRCEGWKWIEVAVDFPYGHTFGLRRLMGEAVPPDEAEQATYDALKAEFAQIEVEQEGVDDLPDDVDARLGEIETAMEAFQNRPVIYVDDEKARAGVFVSVDGSGCLRIERGYVRPEDERRVETADVDDPDGDVADSDTPDGTDDPNASGDSGEQGDAEEEDDTIRPLPDRLITELTAHRTLALRDALANDPEVAFIAALHLFCLKTFYPYALESCLEIDAKSATFASQAPGLADTPSALSIAARHDAWAQRLPTESSDLWDALVALNAEDRSALFAHCVSQSINAVNEAYNRRPKALAHADLLATCLQLDMAAVGWQPTVETYLGRVTKARILQAVQEAKGEAAAQIIDHLKKPEMANEAERLLVATGWLPEPLRTPGLVMSAPTVGASEVSKGTNSTVHPDGEVETAAIGGEPAMDDAAQPGDDEDAEQDARLTAAE
jgi:ParB family transcriptional regulator, chromosome partitioning protein